MVSHKNSLVKNRKGLSKFSHGISKSIKTTGGFIAKEIDKTTSSFSGLMNGLSNPIVLIAIIGGAVILIPNLK